MKKIDQNKVNKVFELLLSIISDVFFVCVWVFPFLSSYVEADVAISVWIISFVISFAYIVISNTRLWRRNQFKFKHFMGVSFITTYLLIAYVLLSQLIISYYHTLYSWWWFGFGFIAILIPFVCGDIIAFMKDRQELGDSNSKKRLIANVIRYILLFWLIDLFYMSCFNNLLILQFVFGIVAVLIIASNLLMSFTSEKNSNKGFLLLDFGLLIALTIFLIYIIPNQHLQSIITPIIAAVYGGLMTLAGVILTLKRGEKNRKEDLKNHEIEKQEEKRIQHIPYVKLDSNCINASGVIDAHCCSTLNLANKAERSKLENNVFCRFLIKDFCVKNISENSFIFKGIYIDDHLFEFSNDILSESGSITIVQTTKNNMSNAAHSVQSIRLVISDILENEYIINCEFKSSSNDLLLCVKEEIDGITYVGFNSEYTITHLSLPTINIS